MDHAHSELEISIEPFLHRIRSALFLFLINIYNFCYKLELAIKKFIIILLSTRISVLLIAENV